MSLIQTGINPMQAEERSGPAAPGKVRIGGLLGDRIDRCIRNRVMAQDISKLVAPFRDRSDGPDGFRGEFWGKWFTSLVLAWSYSPEEALMGKMRDAVNALLATQTPDGCISSYPYPDQHGMWDTWSRKYVLLGLIHYHLATKDEASLNSACRVLDHFMTQAGPDKINLADCGHWAWQGLPPGSILEPVAMLYRITGRETYRAFAEWIIESWDQPSRFLPQGLRLVENALSGKSAREVGNPKAYEQMSCFEGLCEMYLAIGEQRYLDAAVALADNIRRTELTVVGSGSNHEMWCDCARCQTETLEQPLETCATATWMKLCFRLLKLTGDPKWADELEKSLYNALPAAMTPDGSWWSYYSPLVGERIPSHAQYGDIGLSCCVASGPRALLLTHQYACRQDENGIVVNLYAPGKARFQLPEGVEVTLESETDHPVSGRVDLTVRTDNPVKFSLRLRIPGWSRETRMECGHESITTEPGTYHALQREWKDGDTVTLHLDMRARAIPAPSGAPAFAVTRGPIVLALDNRLTPGDRESLQLDVQTDGLVEAHLVPSGDPDIHLACEVPFIFHKVHIEKIHRTLKMCDYASAGNRWSGENLFRVWLPQPLFMEQAFVPGTWKLAYPDLESRPETPNSSLPISPK